MCYVTPDMYFDTITTHLLFIINYGNMYIVYIYFDMMSIFVPIFHVPLQRFIGFICICMCSDVSINVI